MAGQRGAIGRRLPWAWASVTLVALAACEVLTADPQPVLTGARATEDSAARAMDAVAQLATSTGASAATVASATVKVLESADRLETAMTRDLERSRRGVSVAVAVIILVLVLWAMLEIVRIRKAVSR